MQARLLGLALVAMIVASSVPLCSAADGLRWSAARRTIDLTTQVVRMTTEADLVNAGKADVATVLFGVDADHADSIAWVEAQETDAKDTLKTAKVDAPAGAPAGSVFYQVTLSKALAEDDAVTIAFTAVITNAQTPSPAKLKQDETQKVRFSGNHYILSAYVTETQETKIEVSGAVESQSSLKPTTAGDKEIKYGPYEGVAAFSYDAMSLHYENNGPFLATLDLVREIEVSHWGNVAVTEHFHMRNVGGELKGSFSRFDFQRTPAAGGVAAAKTFITRLPKDATEVYYRDIIGNISTSNLADGDDGLELEVRPRFPLFGGWQTKYTVGYNLPASAVLAVTPSGQYKLTMPFIAHIYDSQVINRATVRIILPELASDITLAAPYPLCHETRETTITYLDTVGRPVVVAAKGNLVEDHIQDFTLTYSFKSSSLIREPLMLIIAFFSFFVVAMIYVRLNFAISKPKSD